MGYWKTICWQGNRGTDLFRTTILLAEIMAENGYYVQAFPDFKQPKTCHTGMVYNRISDQQIRVHSHVERADIIVVLDPGSGNLEWLQQAGEGTIYIFNCDSLDTIIKIMDLEEKTVFYVDVDSLNDEQEDSNPSISMLTVVVSQLGMITTEKFTEDLQKSLLNQYNADHVSAHMKSVSQALAGIKQP